MVGSRTFGRSVSRDGGPQNGSGRRGGWVNTRADDDSRGTGEEDDPFLGICSSITKPKGQDFRLIRRGSVNPLYLDPNGLLSVLFARFLNASGKWFLRPLDAESGAQAGNDLSKDLADAPLAQIKYLSDFSKGEFFIVVKCDYQSVSLRQCGYTGG